MVETKPNVLLIMADDVGWFNISAYNRGMINAPTPKVIVALLRRGHPPNSQCSRH